MERYVASPIRLHEWRAEQMLGQAQVGGGVSAAGGEDRRVLHQQEGIRPGASRPLVGDVPLQGPGLPVFDGAEPGVFADGRIDLLSGAGDGPMARLRAVFGVLASAGLPGVVRNRWVGRLYGGWVGRPYGASA